MPQFFFHYHTIDDVARDDMGCSFETLELAYLDAYRSMVDIGAELLKAHRNPAGHWIEIADAGARSLMDLHFDEIFRPRRRSCEFSAEVNTFRVRINRLRRLQEDLNETCLAARTAVERAHEVLRRARARSSERHLTHDIWLA